MIAMTDAASSLVVDVQVALSEADLKEGEEPPSAAQIEEWAAAAYQAVGSGANEVTIRLVSTDEIISLNRDYRNQDKATNVLSFAFEIDADIDVALLGDVVICHSVIVQEAQAQSKASKDHYAHMVTHGILHLCGYDHEEPDAAEQMESFEIKILAAQGIANPYH